MARLSHILSDWSAKQRARRIVRRYTDTTLVPRRQAVINLMLCRRLAPAGCIVECGVWRGGMSAAMADMLPGRTHYLFDSFEGLPDAGPLDGERAMEWQKAVDAPDYNDNCRAERAVAEAAMARSAAGAVHIRQGWFEDTVPGFVPEAPIAILRLDGDWYDSTLVCLRHLYPHMADGGLLLIDDYHWWDGCARAVHDWLSERKAVERIREGPKRTCYLVKTGP